MRDVGTIENETVMNLNSLVGLPILLPTMTFCPYKKLKIFFFLVLNHPVSGYCIGSRLIRIRGVVTVKSPYPSQIVCLVGIEPESSFHKPSLHCQLSHNHLVENLSFYISFRTFSYLLMKINNVH